MTKSIHNDVLDNGPDYLAANATREILCAGAPASYAEATTAPGSGKMLADVAVTSGDFSFSDGAIDGRKAVVAAKAGVAVDAAGNADHVVLVDDDTSRLLTVDALDSTYPLTTGGGETVLVKSYSITFRDPT